LLRTFRRIFPQRGVPYVSSDNVHKVESLTQSGTGTMRRRRVRRV